MFLNDITYSTSFCDAGALISFNTLSSTGSGSNVSASDIYLIEFTEELTIPSGNIVEISPSAYSLKHTTNFTPQCFVKIKSEYTEGSQTTIKLTVKDANYQTLKTQYKRIICSNNSTKPCISPVEQPPQPQYIVLSIRNNWEFVYNGYILAKFIPTNIEDTIKIKLPRKDIVYLPSRGQNDQIKITISIDKLASYNLSANQIRTLLSGNTAYTIKNANYIFVLDSLGRSLSQIGDIVVTTVPQANSSQPLNVTLKSIGQVEYNTAKAAPIPTASLVRLSSSGSTTQLGELILNPDTYQTNDEIIVLYNNDTITGKINSPLLLLSS